LTKFVRSSRLLVPMTNLLAPPSFLSFSFLSPPAEGAISREIRCVLPSETPNLSRETSERSSRLSNLC